MWIFENNTQTISSRQSLSMRIKLWVENGLIFTTVQFYLNLLQLCRVNRHVHWTEFYIFFLVRNILRFNIKLSFVSKRKKKLFQINKNKLIFNWQTKLKWHRISFVGAPTTKWMKQKKTDLDCEENKAIVWINNK